jgi:hypothetical protein
MLIGSYRRLRLITNDINWSGQIGIHTFADTAIIRSDAETGENLIFQDYTPG